MNRIKSGYGYDWWIDSEGYWLCLDEDPQLLTFRDLAWRRNGLRASQSRYDPEYVKPLGFI